MRLDKKFRPIVILGVPRSGTTLLGFILDAHPDIAIGRESKIMRAIDIMLADKDKNKPPLPHVHPLYIAENNRGWYEKYGLSRSEFMTYVREFLENFFGDYAKREGKSRWGEKSPTHVYYAKLIYEIFPDAQFIHIVRDPRAVCYSRHLWGIRIEDIAHEWQDINMELAEFGKRLPSTRYICIRYEDLVTGPREVVRDIVTYLGENWSDNLLLHNQIAPKKFVAHNETKGVNWFERPVAFGKAIVEGGAENDPERKIDLNSLNKWQRKLRKIQIAKIQKITSRGMKYFEYSMAKGLVPFVGTLKITSAANPFKKSKAWSFR